MRNPAWIAQLEQWSKHWGSVLQTLMFQNLNNEDIDRASSGAAAQWDSKRFLDKPASAWAWTRASAWAPQASTQAWELQKYLGHDQPGEVMKSPI